MLSGGCAMCEPGTFQPEDGFGGANCTQCLDGWYAPDYGAVNPTPCPKPICAASVLTCNKLTGLDQTFDTYPPNTIICSNASAADPCDAPEYCSSLVAQCDNVCSPPCRLTCPPFLRLSRARPSPSLHYRTADRTLYATLLGHRP